MVIMLRKLRTFWRSAAEMAFPRLSGSATLPSESTQPLPAQPEESKSTTGTGSPEPLADRPKTRIDRIGHVLSALRGDLRTLESKVDALQSRHDRLLQSNASPSSSEHLSEVRTALEALLVQFDQEKLQHSQLVERVEQIDAHACGLGAVNDSILSRVENLAKDSLQARDRETSQSDLLQQLQSQLSAVVSSVEQVRSDVDTQIRSLHQELSGRLVGLYLIGCIALTVAVATLIIALTSGQH